jgi:hypothetical protein
MPSSLTTIIRPFAMVNLNDLFFLILRHVHQKPRLTVVPIA